MRNIYKVFLPVSFVFDIGDYKLLTIDKSGKVDSIPWVGQYRIHSVWSPDGKKIFTAGDGIYENKRGTWHEYKGVFHYYTRKIRGTGLNDIFTVGDYGIAAHFNGFKWKVYNELYTDGAYNAVAINKNIVVLVGYTDSKAIIIMGKG